PGVVAAHLERVVVAGHGLAEHVRAGAGGAAGEQGAVLQSLAADDEDAPGALQDEPERLGRGEGDGVLAGLGLHAGGHEHAVDGRLGVRGGDVVDGGGHVLGGDRGAVRAGGVLAQGEGDGVRLDVPLLGETGDDAAVLAGPYQRVVGDREHRVGDRQHAHRGVERAGVGGDRERERAAGVGGGGGGRLGGAGAAARRGQGGQQGQCGG